MIGDPRCSSSSDKLFAVDTVNDNNNENDSLSRKVIGIEMNDMETVEMTIYFFL